MAVFGDKSFAAARPRCGSNTARIVCPLQASITQYRSSSCSRYYLRISQQLLSQGRSQWLQRTTKCFGWRFFWLAYYRLRPMIYGVNALAMAVQVLSGAQLPFGTDE